MGRGSPVGSNELGRSCYGLDTRVGVESFRGDSLTVRPAAVICLRFGEGMQPLMPVDWKH